MQPNTLILGYDEIFACFYRSDTLENFEDITYGDFVENASTAHENHRAAALAALIKCCGPGCTLDTNGFVVHPGEKFENKHR